MDIRVRMYRQGLGDCFLISFCAAGCKQHMMIDCGVLTGTQGGEANIIRAVEDILAVTGGKIDVLVITHEHWDHVSGFVQAREQLSGASIGEIWLAWTEKDSHPVAIQLREHRKKAKAGVEAARARLKQAKSLAATQSTKFLEELALFDGEPLAANARRTTADAMSWVREHESAGIKCLQPGGKAFEPAAIPGIRVYVLGPPENVTQSRKDRPSKRNPEVYQLASGANPGLLAALQFPSNHRFATSPFDSSFQLGAAQQTASHWLREHYEVADTWRRIDDDWLGSSETLALQLDSDTNNTSLVLAIENIATGQILLFPGDAQVGNWLSWHDHAWTYERPNGVVVKRTIGDILASTVLYKVAHHASHNATLNAKGLELMTHPDLVALIPVDAVKASRLEWEMPFDPLLERLQEKTGGRVIRSDTGVPAARPAGVPERTWREFTQRVITTELYVEYQLA